MRISRVLSVVMLCAFCTSLSAAPKLKVSENKRFLVYDDGKPFFYLGDTAWELFHRLNREHAVQYLQDRAAKRFNVIQAVVLAEFDGLTAPNAYGHLPLKNNDPLQPIEAYFEHVDFVVNEAEKLGLFVGMLPTWGDKITKAWGVGPEIFTPENAEKYGEFLGKRYREKPIIWIIGGDRNPDKPEYQAIWRAMAKGLRKGDGGTHLITYHPSGGRSSAEWFHADEWLDFNMMQNGHDVNVPVWERIGREYQRTPIKPVLDGEPLYEDHPIAFKPKERGFSDAADIRKFAYWDVFSGACGHTYGNHCVWQMFTPERKPVNFPQFTWNIALDRPGATQMKYLRNLMESRPYLTRIPDQSMIVNDISAGGKKIIATRDSEGKYAMVYVPASRNFVMRLDKLVGAKLVGWWYNPRTGVASKIDEVKKLHSIEFTPPDVGENIDWVLVIDSADAKFDAPGKVSIK